MYNSNNSMKTWINASILHSNGRWCHRDMAVAYTIVEWLTYTIDNTKKQKTTENENPLEKAFRRSALM